MVCGGNELFKCTPGYLAWLHRNKLYKEEHSYFRHSSNSDAATELEDPNAKKAEADFYLSDLKEREWLWLRAEQVNLSMESYCVLTFLKLRHCPQYLNMLFYKYRNNLADRKEINRLIDQAINAFKHGDYNLDDIDECGKWNIDTPFKTFREVPGIFNALVILKYCYCWFHFKLWVLFLNFWI